MRKDDAMSRTVLLIEDNPANAALVKQALIAPNDELFVVERVRKCSEAEERLGIDKNRAIAAVITNLFLPDSQGLQTITRIFEIAPRMPILVLTSADNEHVAKHAMQLGAQDYVLQHRLGTYFLPRVLQNMLYRAANTTALFAENERARVALMSIDDAVHDYLTGLPSPLLLQDRLYQAIAAACRSQQSLAVLCIGIDRFKHVNYALGRAIGDQLLRSVAERLVATVRGSDTVSRCGGDAFVVVLSGLSHAADAALSAKKILASLRAPHVIDKINLQITATIGIALYPDDGIDAVTLVGKARGAMSTAKEQERGGYGFFEPHMNELAIEHQFVECGVRHALERQELMMHYQPQVDFRTEAIVGAEALVRWCPPKREISPPTDFMAMAEKTGSIAQIGLWALREACRESRSWRDAGLAPIPMAIGISTAELRTEGFAESVSNILRETKMDPQSLELEITEPAVVTDRLSTVAALHALRDMGVHLALDHFGTGSSSLTHLMRFPVDALRIDESLIRSLGTRDDSVGMVNAVIGAGTSFHLRVIAQGVDTREQYLALQRLNCHQGQGRYFREPISGSEFAKLLKDDYCQP
jgi:diguanylate cyclase